MYRDLPGQRSILPHMILYQPSIIPWYVSQIVRLVVWLGILISFFYLILGVITFIFLRYNNHRHIGKLRMKKALLGFLIGVAILSLIVMIEQLFPRLSFGFSTVYMIIN